MNKFIILLLLSLPAHAAPIEFTQAWTVLSNVYTKPIVSTTDGNKYEWFKADLLFGDGSITRYCILIGINELQKLPKLPTLFSVGSFWTNTTIIGQEDIDWCLQ